MGYRNAPDEPGRPSWGAIEAPRRSRARRLFGSVRHDESGQSLLLVVLAMTLIVVLAAAAIDVSDWFVKHHQAQVTADSAALAAANSMSEGGTSSTATTYATSYASKNGLPISSANVNVDTTAETVTVTVPTTGPRFFAGISLGSDPSISARAVASWVIRDCSSSGSNCGFLYAGDDICTGATGVTDASSNPVSHGITVNKKGKGSVPAVVGDVISASNISTNVTGQQNWQSLAVHPATDASNNTCSGPTQANPKPFSSAKVEAVASAYPIDYTKTYPACTTNCDGNHFPPFCTPSYETTAASDTVNTLAPSGTAIYCDAGTGNPNNPATWNGAITVNAGGSATFIGGSVTFNLPTGSPLSPAAGSKLLAYGADCNPTAPSPTPCITGATTSPSPVITISTNGNSPISGDMFAPAGVIDGELGGTPSITGFLEGWDIVYNANGTVSGEGPPVDNQGNFVSDYLVQ